MPVRMDLLPPWQRISDERKTAQMARIFHEQTLSPEERSANAAARMRLYDSLPPVARAFMREHGPALFNHHRKAGVTFEGLEAAEQRRRLIRDLEI